MATLKTNTLTGTSTAGSIAVTGEGNSTTTNLQQGLAKVWSFCTDNVITDSLNTSSSTDVTTGKYTITFTNNTATANVAVSVTCNENLNLNGHSSENSTSTYQIRLKDTSGNGGDANSGSAVHGDLA
tara:strand:+ start:266 stop:646 length:381 start_codon:yes stop_codon:yes gene_type:complete